MYYIEGMDGYEYKGFGWAEDGFGYQHLYVRLGSVNQSLHFSSSSPINLNLFLKNNCLS